MELLQISDPTYKDRFGIKVGYSRDRVYDIHGVAADKKCNANKNAIFLNLQGILGQREFGIRKSLTISLMTE